MGCCYKVVVLCCALRFIDLEVSRNVVYNDVEVWAVIDLVVTQHRVHQTRCYYSKVRIAPLTHKSSDRTNVMTRL